MKLVLAARGFPPDRADESTVDALAHGLAELGHDVLVFAARAPGGAADARGVEVRDGAVRVVHVARADAHPEHWHKSSSVFVARAWRELLARERPDVVHVHHWLGLTRELVWLAALARVPALVSLEDFWTSCALVARKLPDTGADCTARAGPNPCVACAARVPPRVTWVDRSAQYVLFAERQRDIVRELALARGVFARDAAHADVCRTYLGDAANTLAIGVRAPVAVHAPAAEKARWAAEWAADHARAAAAGAPAVTAGAEDWYSERMRAFAEEAWDRAFHAAASGTSSRPQG